MHLQQQAANQGSLVEETEGDDDVRLWTRLQLLVDDFIHEDYLWDGDNVRL
jgi:hypothetical protein